MLHALFMRYSIFALSLGLWQAACVEPNTENAPLLKTKAAPFSVQAEKTHPSDFVWAKELQAALPSIIPAGATVSLFIRETKGPRSFSLRADEPVYLASGIKLFFMVEFYRQLEEGRIAMNEKMRYRWSDVRDGAPAMNRQKIGSRIKLSELLTFMIRDSDNAATDMLIRRLGLTNITAGMAKEGAFTRGPLVNMMHIRKEVYAQLDERARKLPASKLRDTRWRDGHHPRLDLLKKHIGKPYGEYGVAELEHAYDVYYQTGANQVPLAQVGALLAKMQRGELISKRASAEMLERLREVWNSGNRIAGLLGDAAHLVRHKTGTQRRRICDLALVPFSKGPPLVITIAIAGPRHEEAEAILRRTVQEVLELERSERNRVQKKGSDWAQFQQER